MTKITNIGIIIILLLCLFNNFVGNRFCFYFNGKEISAFGTVNGNRNNKDGFWVYFSPSMRDTIKPCLYSCGYYNNNLKQKWWEFFRYDRLYHKDRFMYYDNGVVERRTYVFELNGQVKEVYWNKNGIIEDAAETDWDGKLYPSINGIGSTSEGIPIDFGDPYEEDTAVYVGEYSNLINTIIAIMALGLIVINVIRRKYYFATFFIIIVLIVAGENNIIPNRYSVYINNGKITAFGSVKGITNAKNGLWLYLRAQDTITSETKVLYAAGDYIDNIKSGYWAIYQGDTIQNKIDSHYKVDDTLAYQYHFYYDFEGCMDSGDYYFDSVAVKTSQIINLQEGFDTKIIVSTHTEIVQYILIALAVIGLGVSIGYYGEKKFFLSP